MLLQGDMKVGQDSAVPCLSETGEWHGGSTVETTEVRGSGSGWSRAVVV